MVAFVHTLPGVAVVKMDYDQFSSRYSNPTLFLHNLLCLHSLAEAPKKRGSVHCWFGGESRLVSLPTSLYHPKLASLFASLVRKSLELRKSAVDCGRNTPMAACEYDAGRPCPPVGSFFSPGPWLNFQVFQEPVVGLPLPGVLFGRNEELHREGHEDCSHLILVLVPLVIWPLFIH